MQLDLFEDNRPGILLNIADEFILARDLIQAVSVYEQLLFDYPDDKQATSLLKLVREWLVLLSGADENPGNPSFLLPIWIGLESIAYPSLRSTVLDILIDKLQSLPEPEKFYIPPRFHLGQVLMEAGRHAMASVCFNTALRGDWGERGKFLGWSGDAHTLAGDTDAALKSYLAAFLEDPHSVDMQSVTNLKIAALYSSMQFEAADEIEENEIPAWLPVWGWLHGVFTLPIQSAPTDHLLSANYFEKELAIKNSPLPRIWFEMLTYAERLRYRLQDDRELVSVRRLMKKSNAFIFDCYLGKIRVGR